jgi:hypothetical protein
MSRYSIITLMLLAVSLTLVLGCSDRGDNITKVDLGALDSRSGIWPAAQHPFPNYLTMQIRNPEELLLGAGFLPKEAFPPIKPVPLLILLAPENGNKFHYFQAGLEDLMRDLIASGEIEPMVVYCVGNDPTFGGYFYGNSAPAGYYDSVLGTPLVNFISEDRIGAIINSPSKRGIGGIGQGAYGAFRVAIKNPGLFSSISVADGPLDFDGSDGQSGLMSLFDSVMAEQNIRYLTKPVSDTFAYSYHRDFDSSKTIPTTMMFIGGSLAFSPNDTDFVRGYVWTRGITHDTVARYVTDSLRVRQMVYGPLGGDSNTYIGHIVKSQDRSFAFHLPFDSLGNVYQPVWDRWMANNLENMYEAAGGTPLEGVNIWVASNPGAKWNYFDQTQSWISFLKNEQCAVTEHPYSSYETDPVYESEYLYDLLREMLIFHSDNFKRSGDL